jgi:DNA-binding PucR family transcriptional regulator
VVNVLVNTRPRASLGRVLDDLGPTLLELLHGDASRSEHIGGIAIHDPVDEPDLPRNALILGVGLNDSDPIADLLISLGRQHAVGLILRAPVPMTSTILAAADQSGVAVLGFTRGASWTQLSSMLRSLLAEDGVGIVDAESFGGIPAGDLFALANAITALIDAPVTIEDRNSRVLAFSGRQEEADASRVETILGRQVPEEVTRSFLKRGVFRELYRSDKPLWVDPEPPDGGGLPRVAIAVRAGDEVLGSIWVAVREPLDEQRSQALQDAAKLVALHMLRLRAGADVQRRLRTDLLSTALEGGVGAREALSRLGLTDQPVVVLALSVLDPVDRIESVGADASLTTDRQRASDGFAMHLSAVHPRCASALVGDVAYGLVPVSSDGADAEERGVGIAEEFLRRIGDRSCAVIAVGPVARNAAELSHARTSVDRVLRVLRARRGVGQRVAQLADVHVDALLLELRDMATARGDLPIGPIARLLEYDEQHHGNLVETLRAWLDAFGDVIAASSAVYVHPNTFRYRLRRLAQISGMDLTDPDARFSAMLQLRLVGEPSARA